MECHDTAFKVGETIFKLDYTISKVVDTVFKLDDTACQNVKVGNCDSLTVFCHGTTQLHASNSPVTTTHQKKKIGKDRQH